MLISARSRLANADKWRRGDIKLLGGEGGDGDQSRTAGYYLKLKRVKGVLLRRTFVCILLWHEEDGSFCGSRNVVKIILNLGEEKMDTFGNYI